jgi:PD-(D/E)XK nuclease superfamily
MTDPEPLEEKHLSWSQLQTLGDCGEKFRLSYVVDVPRAPQGALIAGRAIHAAIEWAETPQEEFEGWCPVQDLTHGLLEERVQATLDIGGQFRYVFDAMVQEEGGSDAIRWAGKKLINTSVEYPRFLEHVKAHKPLHRPGEGFIRYKFGSHIDPETAAYLNRLWAAGDIPAIVKVLQTGSEDDRWWMKMGPVFLKRYCQLRVEDEAAGVKLWDSHVERRITARLPSGTLLTGFVDAALTITGDGEVRVRDWKSGAPGRGSPLQLAIYAWLLGEALDVHPTSGEFVYLRAEGSKMRQLVDGERFARLVALVPDVMARHEAQAAAGVYPFNPGWQCGACSVKAFCAYGKELPDD